MAIPLVFGRKPSKSVAGEPDEVRQIAVDLRRRGEGMAWEGVIGAHGHRFPLLTKGIADFRSVWIAYGKRMDCVLKLRLKATV